MMSSCSWIGNINGFHGINGNVLATWVRHGDPYIGYRGSPGTSCLVFGHCKCSRLCETCMGDTGKNDSVYLSHFYGLKMGILPICGAYAQRVFRREFSRTCVSESDRVKLFQIWLPCVCDLWLWTVLSSGVPADYGLEQVRFEVSYSIVLCHVWCGGRSPEPPPAGK